MRQINNYIQNMLCAVLLLFCIGTSYASSHREAPLIANDPLADNVDVYAFRSPDNPDMITLIATYVPLQLPQGGPNYYTFGENIRYEIHVDNDAAKPGDEIVYRFTFKLINEDPTTFFNIRLGKQNQKASYRLERSIDGGVSFQTIVTDGIVPPNNIGMRSIMGGAGLNTTYDALFQSGITTATSGERIFAGPTDDPFFVDLGGIFDLGDAPRQNGMSVDGLACFNVSALAIQVPISVLLKAGAPSTPENILDPNYVIGVWASASRQSITTLSNDADPTSEGNWVQVSRLGMPLTNEAVIPIGDKDYWNSISPYDEITETTLDKYFYNPELALYMDDDLFGGAVPSFAKLRIQKNSLGAFDFTNGADGLYGLKGNPALAGTALDDAVFGNLLLPGPGMPRSVDLWPAFHTGVPNVIPYQLATGKNGNPLAAGKPFVNNFLPNGGDMLRLNMAVPPTPRTHPQFSSLGLIQAAVLGLTTAPYNTNTNIEFIPNMDGFPNGRRLEDDVTRIELQAVSGAVLAAVGLWYDDYDPATSPSPVTNQLLNVITYTTGVEQNDRPFTESFPYLAQPNSGTGECSGQIYKEIKNPIDADYRVFVSSNTQMNVGVFSFDASGAAEIKTFANGGTDADGIYYDSQNDVLYQLNRTKNVIDIYNNVLANLNNDELPELISSSTSDFTNGREIAVYKNKLVVAQDADPSNGSVDKFVVYTITPNSITLDKVYSVAVPLWGIHLDGNTLYAVQDVSDKLLVFNNFFGKSEGAITADKTITIQNMVRTHGLTYDKSEDLMLLTDVANAMSATDGAIAVVRNFSSKIGDDMIEDAEQIIIEGPNSLLGNPVDVAYSKQTNLIYVAERAKDGGRVLRFAMPTENGDFTPTYNELFAGASALYLTGDEVKEVLDPDYQLYVSSNTTNQVGVYSFDTDDNSSATSFTSLAKDADGIYYDAKKDVLYQLNRTDNVVNAYSNVKANLALGLDPVLTATSTSDFTNGREIAVYNNKLVVVQDADASNGSVDKFYIYNLDAVSITLDKVLDVSVPLWGIHLDGNTLYAVQDLSDKLLVFTNFFSKPTGSISPDRTITIANMLRTHGLTYDKSEDLMILTDVANAMSATDGAISVIRNFSSKIGDNMITDAEQIIIEGPNSLLGNPVDVAYAKQANRIYVAERAKDGGRVLGYDMPAENGDFSPVYNSVFAGASAVYLTGDEVEVIADPAYQIFVSSNTINKIGVYSYDEANNSSSTSFTSVAGDADGIYYDENSDILYQLNRTANVVNAYGKVRENLALGLDPVLVGTSTSDFTNGREITVYGKTLIVVQDAAANNDNQDRFLIYELSGNDINFVRGLNVDVALWGAHLDGTTLYAVQDLSDKILVFDDILETSGPDITPSQTIAIENMVRTHGITYARKGDIMILTDVGDAASATDGAFTVITNFNTKASDNVITNDEQIIVEGNATSLGNPVDIAYDEAAQRIYIAERLVDGGKLLGFDMPTVSDNVAPVSVDVFAGASALYLSNSREAIDIVRPDIAPFDPKFSADILVAGRLLGSNEVPPVTTTGLGVATVTFNSDYTQATVNATVANLSSAFTNVHIHSGKQGENGPVVFDLTDDYQAGRLTSTISVTSDDVSALISGDYYINFHTVNNPNGELRTQLALESAETYTALLDGQNQNPAVRSSALGLASLVYTSNTNVLEINVLASNLTGPITSAHLHIGAEGEIGSVVEDLSDYIVGNTIKTKIQAGSYINDLRSGNIYINVHTETYPNGEIRANFEKVAGVYNDTWLTGGQEVPAVETNAIGLSIGVLTPDLQTYNTVFLIDNAKSELVAGHLHLGALGTPGGVVLDLSDGIFLNGGGSFGLPVDSAFVANYLSGNLYLNLHTEDNPAGEVRGQVYRVAREAYVYDLCQSQEVGSVTNAGNTSGSGMFAYNRDYDEAHLMATVNGLSSGFQGAHIHNGALGENGPVVFDFADKFANNGAFFYTSDFTSELAGIINTGNAYVNIHTVNNPNGEVRGQLVKSPNCPFSSEVIDVDGKQFEIQLFPNPINDFVVIEFEGDQSLYNNSIIRLVDVKGRLLMQTKVSDATNRLNTANLPTGVYTLMLTNDNYTQSFKVVKM